MCRSGVCTFGSQIIGFQITDKNKHIPPEPQQPFFFSFFLSFLLGPKNLETSVLPQAFIPTLLAPRSCLFCLPKVLSPPLDFFSVSIFTSPIWATVIIHLAIWSLTTLCLQSCTLPSVSLIVTMCSVIQSCLALCDSMNCSLPGSSVHGISRQ